MRSKRVSIVRTTLAILAMMVFMTSAWAAPQEKVLHSFDASGKDEYNPIARLVFDAAGDLCGTAASGGVYGHGAVFELKPKVGGGWTKKVLRSFNDNDGFDAPGLIIDGIGNLYGTTCHGGAYGWGTVF